MRVCIRFLYLHLSSFSVLLSAVFFPYHMLAKSIQTQSCEGIHGGVSGRTCALVCVCLHEHDWWLHESMRTYELVSISLSESIIMWMRKIHRRGKKHIFTHTYLHTKYARALNIHTQQYRAERNHVKLFMDCRICIIPFFCIRSHLQLQLYHLSFAPTMSHPSVHPASLTFALNFEIYLLCHINLVARTMLTSQRIAHELNLFHEMNVCIFALSSYVECDAFAFNDAILDAANLAADRKNVGTSTTRTKFSFNSHSDARFNHIRCGHQRVVNIRLLARK